MSKLPEKYKKYFWDCDLNDIDIEQYLFFISERILVYGNSEAIKWLLSKTDYNFIKHIIKNSKNLDKKTINYWNIILNDR